MLRFLTLTRCRQAFGTYWSATVFGMERTRGPARRGEAVAELGGVGRRWGMVSERRCGKGGNGGGVREV